MEAPPVIVPARPRFPWVIAGGVALLVIAAGTMLFFFDPSRYGFYPRCVFHTVTGLECPGCGTQRALHQLLHGHLAAALRDNALFTLGLPVFAFFFAKFMARWMTSGVMPTVNIPLRWIIVAVGGVILFSILRNLPWSPFIYLAPP